MIPLELTILYSADSYPNIYWDTNRNTTEWSVFMTELVLSGNDLTEIKLENMLPQIPGAHVGELIFECPVFAPILSNPKAHFDSHTLFQDMFSHPAEFLNGTAP